MRPTFSYMAVLSAAIAAYPACGSAQQAPAPSGPTCSVLDAGRTLPEQVRETSGLAASASRPGMFWTHNDSGSGAELFLLASDGTLAGVLNVDGVQPHDWEDIETGPCESGHCLFIADIGDNDRVRETVSIYRVAENATSPATAARVQLRYPDGPQDAESMFVLPSRDIYIVTKGRHGTISLYKLPAAHDASAPVTLTKVRDVLPQPVDENDRVTSATASPDGNWVAIRTYRTLYLYRTNDLIGSTTAPHASTFDLTPLKEAQGESVVIGADGVVWLTSEAEDKKMMPTWSRLKCAFPTS